MLKEETVHINTDRKQVASKPQRTVSLYSMPCLYEATLSGKPLLPGFPQLPQKFSIIWRTNIEQMSPYLFIFTPMIVGTPVG